MDTTPFGRPVSDKPQRTLSSESFGFAKSVTPEPAKSALVITPFFRVMLPHPMPGRWVRFWYWLLLGWRWEKA